MIFKTRLEHTFSYVDLICQVIRPVLRDQISSVEVKVESERQYNENLHAAIGQTIFDNSCFSVSPHLSL